MSRPLPSSLSLVLLLLGTGLIAAASSALVQYRQLSRQTAIAGEAMTGGDSERGKLAFIRLGCGACHLVDGAADAQGRVGPKLDGIARRAIVAGTLANTPANLAVWIAHPQHIAPGVGMPDQPMAARDARDIAAYLYTLR